MGTRPTSPPAASNSEGSSTNPLPRSSTLPSPPPPPVQSSLPQPQAQGKPAMDETLPTADQPDKNPDLTHNIIEDFESEEDIVKYQKYEADYVCCLMAKYFSHKDIYGGDVFDMNVAMGHETIKASRRPCVQSYADPLLCFTEGYGSTSGSSFPDETPAALSIGQNNSKIVEKLIA